MDSGVGGPNPPASTAIDFGNGGPFGCRHELGGAYANLACTIEWQCCNGSFVHGTIGCGGPCTCVEETGTVGCLGLTGVDASTPPFGFDAGVTTPDGGTPPPPPPPGDARCTHPTNGGVFANMACTATNQCCNGTWAATGACGSCMCTEVTGVLGCGAGPVPGSGSTGVGTSCDMSRGTCIDTSVSTCGGGLRLLTGACPGPSSVRCCTGTTAPPPPPPPPGGTYPHGPSSIPSSSDWSCTGLTGTTWNTTGSYYTTSFGCWVDSSGGRHQDSGDNCLPACSLASIGCSGLSGPECEYMINWYVADTDRFGCGTKLRITAPSNGRRAVVMAIDRGPNCRIEQNVSYWVLDMSSAVSTYMFGGQTSATERAEVIVEVVPSDWPLGPM